MMFYVMECALIALLPVLYSISGLYAGFCCTVEAINNDPGYKPSFFEWLHLGRKEFLSFRRGTKLMPADRLRELADIYNLEQKNSDANASEIFEKVLPNRWMGVYAKACEYELARRGV